MNLFITSRAINFQITPLFNDILTLIILLSFITLIAELIKSNHAYDDPVSNQKTY